MTSATESGPPSSASDTRRLPKIEARHTPGISVFQLVQGRTTHAHRQDISYLSRGLLVVVGIESEIEAILMKAGYPTPQGDWTLAEYMITAIHYIDRNYRLKILDGLLDEYADETGKCEMLRSVNSDVYGIDWEGMYGGL